MIYGKGINDADYVVCPKVEGIVKWCPFYSVWKGMLKRCYCKSKKSSHPTYVNTIVCDEWLRFSTFKAWMETQDWEGKQLDKDLKSDFCDIYSPKTCIFISKSLNVFINMDQITKSILLPGVSVSTSGKYIARGKEFGKSVYIGGFDSEIMAHTAYINHKLSLVEKFTEDLGIRLLLVKYINSKRVCDA